MKLLWLAPALPWPLQSGEKLRSYHLARRVARQHTVTMVAPVGDFAAARALTEAGIRVLRAGRRLPAPAAVLAGWQRALPATVARYCGSAVRAAVRELLAGETFDLVYLDHLQMTGLSRELAGIPCWLDEHNLESRLWERYAATRGLLWRREAQRLRAWEQRVLAQVRGVSVTSADDLRAAQTLQPAGSYCVVPNATDVAYWRTQPRTPGNELLLTGSLDWPPNRDGIDWFITHAWPQARARGLTARVVGSNPPPAFVAHCAEAGIPVDANVPTLQPYYARARAVLVPLQVGGGTRLKVVEAFAARVPVIATALAVEGLRAEAGVHYLPAETSEQLLESLRLTADAAALARLTDAALAHVAEHFDWEQSAATLLAALERVQ